MRTCMINDCAYVGETLLRYFPAEIEVRHVKRTRGLWDKTFGVSWKILRAKADLYHVHYALQDSYIALKTKREPVVVHVHGSDCRTSLYNWKWGRIVRYNLEHGSHVLVSAPDVLGDARKHREDAEYFPIPVDLRAFDRRSLEESDELIVFSPFMDVGIRGTDTLIRAFAMFEKSHPNSKLLMINTGDASLLRLIQVLKVKNVELINPVPHQKMLALYEEADIVATDFKIGALPTSSLEAMAVGRPVIQYVKEDVYSPPLVPPPVVAVQPKVQDVLDGMEKLMDIRFRRKTAELQYFFMKDFHSAEKLIGRVLEIYEGVL